MVWNIYGLSQIIFKTAKVIQLLKKDKKTLKTLLLQIVHFVIVFLAAQLKQKVFLLKCNWRSV